jgi:cupin fold WbuC family metalloprotein
MLRSMYVTPPRHLDPPKPEAFLVLEGRIAFLTFDDQGRVVSRNELGVGGPVGIDAPAGVWHTLIVLTPHAVIYEVKPGHYSAATDKDFAPWAPREGEPGVEDYLRSLA